MRVCTHTLKVRKDRLTDKMTGLAPHRATLITTITSETPGFPGEAKYPNHQELARLKMTK